MSDDRRNIHPADELGVIRAEIKRLKARETALRQQAIEAGTVAPGAEYRVEIVEQRRRTFNKDALPDEILNDPAYWKESTTRIVKTVPLDRDPRATSDAGSYGDPLIDDDDAL